MRTADRFAQLMGITTRHADYLGKGDRVASPELAMRAMDVLGLNPVLLLDPKRRTRPLWDDVEECLTRLDASATPPISPHHGAAQPARPLDAA